MVLATFEGRQFQGNSAGSLFHSLVKSGSIRYRDAMSNLRFLWLTMLVCGGMAATAATVQLKDQAAITGKILAEKGDSIAVDVGYTVLVIPRSQIAKITEDEKSAPTDEVKLVVPQTPPPAAKPSAAASTSKGIYTVASRAAPERSVRELVSLLGEAVVLVRTPSSLGSGFIISEEGFLMTNFHVIEGESQISIEVYHQKGGQLDRRSYRQVRIVAMNKFADLALLKIEDKDAPAFKFVPIGSSDSLAVGEKVFAIGSPLGLERTVTEGIVSTKTRQMAGALYLQTTTQINPGNSGGPLFNLNGEVVGVTNMKITFGEGLGFAIPSESVKYFLEHRDAFAYSNDNPSNPYRYLEPPSRMKHSPALE